MTQFRLDVSREKGTTTLWMAVQEIGREYKPVLAWPIMKGTRDFALMLLKISHRRQGGIHDLCYQTQAS